MRSIQANYVTSENILFSSSLCWDITNNGLHNLFGSSVDLAGPPVMKKVRENFMCWGEAVGRSTWKNKSHAFARQKRTSRQRPDLQRNSFTVRFLFISATWSLSKTNAAAPQKCHLWHVMRGSKCSGFLLQKQTSDSGRWWNGTDPKL